MVVLKYISNTYKRFFHTRLLHYTYDQ